MIPGLYARHPALAMATRTESPQDGFHKGPAQGNVGTRARAALAGAHAGRCIPGLDARGLLGLARAPDARRFVIPPPRPAGCAWSAGAGVARTLRRWGTIPPQPNVRPAPAPPRVLTPPPFTLTSLMSAITTTASVTTAAIRN